MEPTGNGATNIHGAKERLTSLFTEEPQGQPSVEETAGNLAPESLQETETPESTENVESSGNATGDTEEPTRYEVKYGDQVEHLTIDELMKNNLMERDYRHKSMALSDKQKAFEDNETALKGKLQDLEIMLGSEAQKLNDLESLNDPESPDYDPASYVKKFTEIKTAADKLNTWKAELQQAEQDKLNTHLKQEGEKLVQAIPEWLDTGKYESEWKELGVYLNGHNVNIGGYTNHKDVVIARKAMLFDRIQAQDLEDKKVNKPPKSASPGNGVTEEPNKVTSARSKAKKSGHVRDAQAALKELLGERNVL